MFPALAAQGLRAFLSAIERPRIIFWSTVAGVVLNALLNWALIFGNWGAPEMGVRGAAIASLGTTALTFAVLAVHVVLDRKAADYEIFARFWRPNWPDLRDVLRIGVPISITILAETAMFVFASVMMGWLGVVPLAAHGIALQTASATFMVHLGFGNVATIRAGNALGRNDPEHLARGARTVLGLSLAMSLMTIALFLTLPHLLVGAFIDPADPAREAIVATGVTLLAVAALFQLVDGAQVVALGILRGMQDTRVPMWIAVFSYWVPGFGTAMVLGFATPLAGVGVWLGLATGLAFAAVLLTWRWARREALGLTRVQPDAKRVRPPSA